MTPATHDTLGELRAALEPLEWPDRFERLAQAHKAADAVARDALVALRSELADLALAELGPQWGGVPFKDAILRLPKRMRGPLSTAAKRVRDRRIAAVMSQGGGRPLDGPADERFAIGLDERAVEMPLALASARFDQPGEVLDAGSALNLPLVRTIAGRPRARLTHFTLPGSQEPALPLNDHFVYAFGDLRALPFADGAFARAVCVSTLEHVGMDATRFGAAVPVGGGSAAQAVAELLRVLAPAGTLLITVPYGRAADHGWFRVFDRDGLQRLLEPAGACDVALRFFYYDRGWLESGAVPPRSALESPLDPDVVTGVAIAHISKPAARGKGDAS